MKKLPGIFNDVIGPVMRGPSSSHTAASWRIGKIGTEILNEPLQKALIEFDREGAWAPNYREQGTTMGMNGGLLGLEITDERMKDTEGYAQEKRIAIEYKISSFETNHANTVRLTLWGKSQKKVQIIAVSLGGGSFEIRSVDGFQVQLSGDLYYMLISTKNKPDQSEELKTVIPSGIEISSEKKKEEIKYLLKSSQSFSSELVRQVQQLPAVDEIALIHPIMPVIGGKQSEMPFSSVQSLIDYAEENNADLGDMGLIYEKCISEAPEQELIRKMEEIIHIIHKSIATGLAGTSFKDRILQQQSHLIEKAEKEGKIKDSIINRIIANVSAIMESKSSMEVIVAVPTAGSCGTVGGSLKAISENLRSSQDELIKAYFAAGIVGAYFAQGPGFSAEEHGCQVECGAAAGMAAAGIVQLLGGTVKQAIGAASMAIQNMIGLVCDPVADRVEVPCLGKNISAAVNAYASAIMSVSGYDYVIPLDQVIKTVSRVSKTMPNCVKCTGKGGLAITEEAIKLKLKLAKK
ncbi:L-serine ammonia-lyase, iron-sulfur-dependent, subunit alpha [Maribellus mangrovi]|uniref:L-serine ammonia-lyase, iron-sulfur-dependent, subunit alpha n=1 Tax=Maribellus mangrovi TaxID=3133146 RepID=UPI0030EED4FC